jgi:hypothetical protein
MVVANHAGERLCRGEEHRVRDVVNAGHYDPQAGPWEDVRVVALARLVRLEHVKQNV